MNKVYGTDHERYSAVYLPTVYFCAVCRLYPRLPQLALYVEFSSLYFVLITVILRFLYSQFGDGSQTNLSRF